jgi:hypothetical protein
VLFCLLAKESVVGSSTGHFHGEIFFFFSLEVKKRVKPPSLDRERERERLTSKSGTGELNLNLFFFSFFFFFAIFLSLEFHCRREKGKRCDLFGGVIVICFGFFIFYFSSLWERS